MNPLREERFWYQFGEPYLGTIAMVDADDRIRPRFLGFVAL